jgi:predicted permease
MPPLSRIARLWRSRRNTTARETDLDDELHAYVAMSAEQKVARGMNPEDARRSALIELGGLEQVKEAVRDVRRLAWLETGGRDLRYAARALARTPGFTAAAVLALALGIGANTAIVSVVDSVLLRPLPYAEADRLTVILHGGTKPVAPANYLDWRRQSTTFEAMGAADFWTPNLTGGDRPEKLWALRMTADVLPLLGIPPLLGRFFRPEEDAIGRDRVAVLSYGLWQRSFSGEPQVIGRRITLDGESYEVIGVMPSGFRFAPFWATRAALWAPLALAERATSRAGNSLRVFARLKPGVSLAAAQAELATITGRLEKEFPGTNRNVVVTPLKERVVGDVRRPLLVLLVAVGFVLTIACANVAHMLLARGAARRREIAVRMALGAGRSRVVRQLLTESLLLGLLGGAAGLLLGFAGVRGLLSLHPIGLPRTDTISLDARVLAFTMVVSLATGALFGLVPALRAARLSLSEAFRDGERGSTEGIGRRRARSILIASEFALALMLLVGAGLMMRSFLALRGIDPGFDPRNVITAVVSVTGSAEAQPGRRALFFQSLVERIQRLPGVTAASGINHLPLAGDIWGFPFWVEGEPRPRPGEQHTATYRVVLPGYFRTMGVPILRGRDFTADDRLDSPGVAVVNQKLAGQYWPGEDAIGKRINLDAPGKPEAWLTVVGVAKDTVRSEWAAAPEEEVFLPYLQNRSYLENPGSHVVYLTLVVRTSGEASVLASAIRGTVGSLAKDVAVSDIQTMDAVVDAAMAQPRFYLLLLGAFAAVALTLAAVGIYGVISYSVTTRTREIGVRMALGATRAELLRLVVGQAMKVVVAGAAVGLAGALALTRLMETLLYGVGAADPLTFLSVSLVLVAVALLASYVPARRAMRADPLRALRYG